MTVWPLRTWTKVLKTSPGGEIISESDYINPDFQMSQKFVTQYERLSSIDVYISKFETGRYIYAEIRDKYNVSALKVIVDVNDYQLPCYVTIPMELTVEVGEEYTLVLQGCRSKYYAAYESIPDDTAYVGSIYINDAQEVPGVHLAAIYNYRLPISKWVSLGIIFVIAAIYACIYLATFLYFKKFPDKNSLMTIGKAIKYVANPVATVVYLVLMIMVFPLRIFDLRAVDIIFYEIGLLICAFFTFYAINHRVVTHKIGISFWESVKNSDKLRYILIMFSMAMAIWYGCAYMNDLYDIYHTLSERKMMIWLLIMMLLTFSLKEAVNVYNAVWLVGSVIYGANYYRLHALADTEKEYDLNNAALKYGIIIVILAGVLLMNAIVVIARYIVGKIKTRDKSQYRLSAFGAMLFLFLLLIVIFRNTRWWGVVLALTFCVWYLRIMVWPGKKDYLKIVSGGFMMNFAISLVFSLMHRYFAGYVLGRFGFIFHTVTVTAEYFTFMGAVACVLLVAKIVAAPNGCGIWELFKTAWKEIIFFGWTMAYAIFTVSRTAYLAIGVCVFLVIVTISVRYKRQFARIIGVLVLSVILCFPAAFTLQRIIPAIVADPVIYVIDETDEFIRGGAAWGSTNFMCVERFTGLFATKILGVEIGDYSYPLDVYNYDSNGNPLYDHYGYPIDESNEESYYEEGQDGRLDVNEMGFLLASNTVTRAEFRMLLETMNEYVDVDNPLDVMSNGRITIFRSYIKELNLTGHDEMGAELPNGEIAIHAHNTYIQVAFDHGIIVGALFAVLMLFAVIYSIYYYGKHKKEEPLSLMPFAVIIGFIVAGISEWVFQLSNPMTLALFLSIAPLVYRKKCE